MKKILPIVCLVCLFVSCSSERKYKQLAEEFLKDIPSEKVIATLTDKVRHCIFYIEERDLGYMTEVGDKYDNIIKYDLKTRQSSKLLRDDAKMLNSSLEQGAGFITIDYFEVNSSSIFVASYVDVGFYDLALYTIDTDQWHFLGCFPFREDRFSITDNEIEVACSVNDDCPFPYEDFFGPMTWWKRFDMTGRCIANTVRDELNNKTYDGSRLIEKEDVDYMNEIFFENFIPYIEEISYSADRLIEEHERNPVVFKNTYEGRNMLISGIVADLGTRSETDYEGFFFTPVTHYYHYIELRGENHSYPTMYFPIDNENELMKVNVGETIFIQAKYSKGCFEDCKFLKDQSVLEEYVEQYKEYMRQQRLASM